MHSKLARTQDGYHWSPASGLQHGLPCAGVIQPPEFMDEAQGAFDVLVIGAGYTGLTAARDVATAGLKTLILESRDRIGGRTWTSELDGYRFEMGGSWVHWFQPHVWRELSRYDMVSQLVVCPDYTKKKSYCSIITDQERRNISHEEEQALSAAAVAKFVDIDGNHGKTFMPFPFGVHWDEQVLKFAHMSVADRVAQIKDQLSDDERLVIETVSLVCSGGTLENTAFLDFLRWWAASNHDYETFMASAMGFKLQCGQSEFATQFFREAVDTGNLSYSFSTVVSSVDSSGQDVAVTTSNGRRFSAKRVICTVPLNVLNKVQFNPPLDTAKTEAATLKHVNHCCKVHAEIKDPEMRSWIGFKYPANKLIMGAADGTTPSGNTHVVFFGSSQNQLHAEEDVDDTLKAVKEFAPADMDVQRLVFHNWVKDEFAEGAWAWYRPGMEVKYLEPLRKRQGPVLFANSDWAGGAWRSFIDGAIQSGTEAAWTVRGEMLRKMN